MTACDDNETQTGDDKEAQTGDDNENQTGKDPDNDPTPDDGGGAAGKLETLSADSAPTPSVLDATEGVSKEENQLTAQDKQADNPASQDSLTVGGQPLRISSEFPQFSLSVQSNQADLESVSASLDNSLEPREMHLQALGRNTDGQPHFSIKRTVVSILGEGYAPVRAVDPTPKCLHDLFGFDVDVMCIKGQKEGANQDNWSVSQTLFNDSGEARLTIFCVVDGHGPLGHEVSARLCQSLPANILPRLLRSGGDLQAKDIRAVMHEAFIAAQQDLISFSAKQQLQFDSSGSTALIGLQMPFDGKTHIAWVGDVQAAALNQEPPFVSTPHLPVGDEAERVKVAGGDVLDRGPGIDGGPLFRLYLKGQSAPGLAISRAFGDFAAADAGVICEPDHAEVVSDAGSMLVLASDGVWDFIDVAEVEDLRGQEDSTKSLAHRIVEFSLGKRAGRGLPCDDATCLIRSF